MTRTVLIVDDDPDIRELVRFKMAQEGFTVLEASDGEAALRAVAEHDPDLVLLDILMPGLSGLEVLEQIRSTDHPASARIILLTTNTADSEVTRGFVLGADDYVVKPFSPRELTKRVKATLSRPAA